MDTITQGLLGAVTAQLGFRQKIGRDATWVAAAAAVAPDLDIFTAPLLSLAGMELDGLSRLRYHRGVSHSLLLAPFLSLLITAIWWMLRRRRKNNKTATLEHTKSPPFWMLYLCVFIAVFTHPLLDWCTSYGTRLLEPITNTRYAIDAVPIIDIIYTPLLILTLIGCAVARRLRGGRAPRATLIIGWTGFLLSIGYLVAGCVLHNRAVEKAMKLADSTKIVRGDAYPALGTIFLWRAVIETDDAWRAVRVHHFSNDPPEKFKTTRVSKAATNSWIEKARKLPEYDIYRWFAGGRLREEYKQVDGVHIVQLHDMRYSLRTDGVESLWPLIVEFDNAGKVIFVGRRTNHRQRTIKELFTRFWYDIWNP